MDVKFGAGTTEFGPGKDEMEIQEMLMAKLVEFYVSRTKMKAAQIRKLLKRDSWFGAEKCLKLGLADEVAG